MTRGKVEFHSWFAVVALSLVLLAKALSVQVCWCRFVLVCILVVLKSFCDVNDLWLAGEKMLKYAEAFN